MDKIFNEMNESIINVLNILEVEGKCRSWAEMHPNQSLGARSNPTRTLLAQCPEILTHPPWRGGGGGGCSVSLPSPHKEVTTWACYIRSNPTCTLRCRGRGVGVCGELRPSGPSVLRRAGHTHLTPTCRSACFQGCRRQPWVSVLAWPTPG